MHTYCHTVSIILLCILLFVLLSQLMHPYCLVLPSQLMHTYCYHCLQITVLLSHLLCRYTKCTPIVTTCLSINAPLLSLSQLMHTTVSRLLHSYCHTYCACRYTYCYQMHAYCHHCLIPVVTTVSITYCHDCMSQLMCRYTYCHICFSTHLMHEPNLIAC